MLKILIYNDRREEAIILSRLIKHLLMKIKVSHELSVYLAPEKILNNLKQNHFSYDILIFSTNSSHWEVLAKELRSQNLTASLILLTEIPFCIEKLILYRPSGFITDMKNRGMIVEAFRNSYLEQKNNRDEVFLIKKRDQLIKVSFRDIDYFENDQRQVILHNNRSDEKINFYAKFSDLCLNLPKDQFVKCHQSFIVNLNLITSIDKHEKCFVLASNHPIPISKRMFHESLSAFENYNSQQRYL